MPDDDGGSKKHGGVAAAVVAGVFTVVAAIIGGVFLVLSKEPSDAGPVTGTSSPEPSSTTTTESVDCDQQFRITKPGNGTRISATGGVVMEGTACESDLIWVLDYDPDDGSYFQVNSEALRPVDGHWIQVNKPIGDPADDIGTTYTIVVIRATQACSDRLSAAEPDADGTVWFNPLPSECAGVGDTVNTRTVQVLNAGP